MSILRTQTAYFPLKGLQPVLSKGWAVGGALHREYTQRPLCLGKSEPSLLLAVSGVSFLTGARLNLSPFAI